jgi:hypothetical protein
MKPIKPAKPTNAKLTLHRETLRQLNANELDQVAGGTWTWLNSILICPPTADTCQSVNARCATLTIEDNG